MQAAGVDVQDLSLEDFVFRPVDAILGKPRESFEGSEGVWKEVRFSVIRMIEVGIKFLLAHKVDADLAIVKITSEFEVEGSPEETHLGTIGDVFDVSVIDIAGTVTDADPFIERSMSEIDGGVATVGLPEHGAAGVAISVVNVKADWMVLRKDVSVTIRRGLRLNGTPFVELQTFDGERISVCEAGVGESHRSIGPDGRLLEASASNRGFPSSRLTASSRSTATSSILLSSFGSFGCTIGHGFL